MGHYVDIRTDNWDICADIHTIHWPLHFLHDTGSSGPREEKKPLNNEKEQFISHMAGITVM